ncbi:MAG TPA: hypothetical protein IAC60_00205 [Candidatus Enterosoma merdigallinarum]|nr:hypothetical protein [Candidatus Enterosoma merdigallinarum]
MRSLAIPALLLLLGNVSPAAAEASRAASLAAVLPDDCPLYTDVDDDLADMGVSRILYPDAGVGDVQMLTLVEWGYLGTIEAPEGFGLYLYLYDPSGRPWSQKGDVTLSLGDGKGDFYDSAFVPFSMTLLDVSDDGVFTKWSLDDAGRAYSMLPGIGSRDYRVGSVTMRQSDGTDRAFAIGTEYSFSGYPRHGADASTLVMEKTPFRTVRAEVYPFTSDFGRLDGEYNLASVDDGSTFRSTIDAYSVVFSLPSWVGDFGDLVSVHYDYYKYRTDWIVGYNTRSDYEEALSYRGVDGLRSDGNYAAGKTPSYGFCFAAPFDYDDLDVDPSGAYDTHGGFTRFYNNNVDSGHHELRIDNPSWVMWLGDDASVEYDYTSDVLLDYAASYRLDTDRTDDLPVLNGTVSNELFYVPKYSEEGLFKKYGHVENAISRSDLLSINFDSMAASRFDQWVPFKSYGFLFEDFCWLVDSSGKRIDESLYDGCDDLYDLYRAVLSVQDPSDASYLFGDGSLPLLDDYSPDDPVVQRVDDEYSDGLSDFVAGNDGRDLYRLTYDMGFSNSYRCFAGSAGMLDGTWTATTISASKTDAVFGFRFIDFTFEDGSRTYVLPAASDPFDITGNPSVPAGEESGLPRWAVILIACVALFLVIGILSLFSPVIRLVLRGLLLVVELAIDVVYVVLVWWWLALIRKAQGEETPPLWVFGKK